MDIAVQRTNTASSIAGGETRLALKLCFLLCALTAIGLAAAPDARADGAVTRSGGTLTYDSDSQDAENLVISRPAAAFECAPIAAPCLQFANGPQKIRDDVAGADCVRGHSEQRHRRRLLPDRRYRHLPEARRRRRLREGARQRAAARRWTGASATTASTRETAPTSCSAGRTTTRSSTTTTTSATMCSTAGPTNDTIFLGGGDDNVNGGTGAPTR